MPNDEPEVKEEAQAPESPKKKSGNLIPILAGALVFVIFVVIFSIKFGVFDQEAPGNPTVATEAGAKTQPAAQNTDSGPQDDFYGQYYGAEPGHQTEASDSTLSPEDSVKQMTWYEAQKKEIASERAAIEEEKGQLQQLHDKTDALLRQRKALEEANLAALAKLYESMKPEQLVPILGNLPDDKVSLIISKMKKQTASEVMAKLDPARAARITNWLLSLETDQ